MSAQGKPKPDTPDITVVVVSYQDAGRLPRAIRSVLTQSLTSVEVVVVDDGSRDGSHEVALEFARLHPARVRAFQLPENTGSAGAPRNLGIQQARGTWIMFLDSDDELAPHACRNLLAAAEETGVNLVSGLCSRVDMTPGGRRADRRHDWYPGIYSERRVIESVDEFPDLLAYDTISTNKCYRREFLLSAGLSFPVGILYEDLLFCAAAYIAAGRITLIPQRVYLWYIDERPDRPSVTSQRHDLANFTDRMEIHRRIDELLKGDEHRELRLVKDRKFLVNDMVLQLRALPQLPKEFRDTFTGIAQPYLAGLDPRAFEACPPVVRLCAELLRRGEQEHLDTAIDTLLNQGKTCASLTERDGRIYWYDSGDPDDERLDVTDLGLIRQSDPLGRPRNVLTSLRVDRRELTLAGRIANPLGAVPPTAKLGLTLELRARRRNLRTYRLVLDAPTHHGTELHWTARMPLRRSVRPLGIVDPVWDPRVVLTVDGRLVPTDISVAPDAELRAVIEGLAVPVTPRLSRLTGDRFVPEVSGKGHLAFRLESHGLLARAGAAGIRKARRSGLGRWLRRSVIGRIGRTRRKLLSADYKADVYRRYLIRLPLARGSAVFESHMGRQYSDNPRAVYEELRRRLPDAPVTWSYKDSREGFPDNARLVRRGSWRYHLALARAEFWVDNQGFPHHLPKREATRYLQTWHGTALKRMGFDVPAQRAASLTEQQQTQQATDRFDWFLVRGGHDERTLVRSLRLQAEVLRTGYPRNDVLVQRGAGREAERAELRRRLGIPESHRVLLYAPTFRQSANGTVPPLEVPFDLHRFVQSFGGEWVLLIRAHYLTSVHIPTTLRHAVVDVSQVHDVTPLLLASDALVTDYSSILFDYALLDRPMLFLQQDRTEYLEEGRGSYFDLHDQAPGPIVEDEPGLFAALSGLDEQGAAFSAARREFAVRYGEYDRGQAAQEVVQRVFVDRAAPLRPVRLPGASRPADSADAAGTSATEAATTRPTAGATAR